MRKTRLLKHFLLLCALIAGSTSVWGADEVYKSLTFPDDNSANNGLTSNQYISTWTAKSGTFEWSISNFNNNNWQNDWTYIKCGRKNNASVGTIVTKSSIDNAITKVVVTVDAFTSGKVNSFKVYASPNADFTGDNIQTITATIATGKNTFVIPTPTANLYYKIEIDCASGDKNGLVTISKVEYYKSDEGPQLENNDLALTGAPVALSFDLYNNSSAQIINYTATSTGAVTVSASDYVTTVVDQTNKKITVTPTAVTPSVQTITVSQAADETYEAGSATFTVTIEDSTPFDGVIFDATEDKGTSPIVKENVSLACPNGVLNNGTEYRFYKNSTTTISTTDGSKIKKIEFIGVSGYAASNFSNQTGWTTVGDNGTWEGEAESVSFVASVAQVRATIIKVTVEQNTDPSITANDLEIAYDATAGAISYTINKATNDGVLSASTTSDWLTIGTVGETVPFTCSANTVATARTATVTLTYTYDTDKTVTKDVTVTQTAAPVVYSTIPALFDAATSTETNVNVTFGGWVVSGVNGSTAYVTDNEGNGFIIYKSNHGFEVNDKLSGTVTGTPLKLYKGAAEFTNLTASTTGLTVTNDGVITVITNKSIADLGGVNTGAVFTLSNLTYDGTNLSDGTNTIQPYNTLYAGTFEANKTYNVTGVYLQYDSKKEILPRSADDIEEVVSTEASIAVEPTTVNVSADGGAGTITVTYNNITEVVAEVYFCDADGDAVAEGTYSWVTADIDNDNNVEYLIDANEGEARTAYMMVYAFDDDVNGVYSDLITISQGAYVAPPTPVDGYYVKVTSTDDITDGQYLIVYEGNDNHDAVAFNGGLETLDAVGNVIAVTIEEDEIAATNVTRAAEFTIDVAAGTLKSASGYYIGNLSNSNGLSQDTHYDMFAHVFSIDDDGNAVIASHTIDGFIYLRYNYASNQNRFRYYKSGQQAVQLYKYIPEYETVETAHEYITFCSTKALDFSQVEGLDAYIVTKVNTSSVSTTKVETAVPAGTGLVLKKTVNATSFEVPVVAEATALEGNLLTGVTEPTLIGNTNDTDYILYDGKFYPASEGTLPAGKAYLRVDNTNAPELGLDFSGETTGIVNVNRETITNNQYYTLDGRRVENPTNGIYIINGRKVVIK